MATRPIFIPTPDKKTLYMEQNIEFRFYNGFSVTQKAKSIASLHDSACQEGYKRLLEVSTKSDEVLGHRLSAFNLMIETDDYGTLRASITKPWGLNPVKAERAERALWTPNAPVWMLLTFVGLMGAVWGHFLIIGIELYLIRKDGIS